MIPDLLLYGILTIWIICIIYIFKPEFFNKILGKKISEKGNILGTNENNIIWQMEDFGRWRNIGIVRTGQTTFVPLKEINGKIEKTREIDIYMCNISNIFERMTNSDKNTIVIFIRDNLFYKNLRNEINAKDLQLTLSKKQIENAISEPAQARIEYNKQANAEHQALWKNRRQMPQIVNGKVVHTQQEQDGEQL